MFVDELRRRDPPMLLPAASTAFGPLESAWRATLDRGGPGGNWGSSFTGPFRDRETTVAVRASGPLRSAHVLDPAAFSPGDRRCAPLLASQRVTLNSDHAHYKMRQST